MGNKSKEFNNSKKQSNLTIVLIVLLSIITSVTLAFFSSSDFASKYLGTSGKVKIEAVGRGNKSIEDKIPNSCNLEIELDRDYGVLIPNMPITIFANCKVYKSTTKPLMRASFSVTVLDATDNPLQSDEYNISSDIYGQIVDIVDQKDYWYRHTDGYYYYVENENGNNSILKEINATSDNVIIPFIDGDEVCVPSYINDSYSGYSIKIKIVFQAIQNYIPDDNGNKMSNTITNSLKIFNEFTTTLYESSPISWFETTELTNGTVSLTAKADATYPSYLKLPEKTSDGKTITSISSDFAKGNASIKNVYVSSNYTTIADSAFESCGLLSVDLSDSNITEIPKKCFYNSKLVSIKLPTCLRAIRMQAFMYCPLTTLEIPEGCTTCEKELVGENSQLSYISLPSTLTNIVYDTIEYVPNLTTIKVASGNPVLSVVDNSMLVSTSGYLMACVKSGSNVKTITIPENITRVFKYVFYGSKSIENIVLGKNMTSIDFRFPTSLKTLSLGTNTNFSQINDTHGNSYITSKDQKTVYAINLANSANTLTMPNSVVTFSYNILPYSNISQITHINIGSSYKVSETNELYYYEGLKTVSVDSSNTNVKTISNNELISYNGKTFYIYFRGCDNTEYSIPNGVTSVNGNCIRENNYLEKLTIPSSLTYLNAAFGYYCRNLKEINIPSSITQIQGFSFYRCNFETLTTYGFFLDNCVQNCYNLKNITINNCSKVGSKFMNSCTSLEWVEFTDTTPPTFSSQLMFENIKTNFVIYVPDSAVNAYKTANNLSIFADKIKPVSERI